MARLRRKGLKMRSIGYRLAMANGLSRLTSSRCNKSNLRIKTTRLERNINRLYMNISRARSFWKSSSTRNLCKTPARLTHSLLVWNSPVLAGLIRCDQLGKGSKVTDWTWQSALVCTPLTLIKPMLSMFPVLISFPKTKTMMWYTWRWLDMKIRCARTMSVWLRNSKEL